MPSDKLTNARKRRRKRVLTTRTIGFKEVPKCEKHPRGKAKGIKMLKYWEYTAKIGSRYEVRRDQRIYVKEMKH